MLGIDNNLVWNLKAKFYTPDIYHPMYKYT
jgi:hypothetical protein